MGIIRTAIGAAAGTVKSGFQDQFLEAIEPEEMDAQTVFTRGVMVRKGSNRPTTDVISDGSVIHVYDNQFMILVDGGKIIDYTQNRDTTQSAILQPRLCSMGSLMKH